MSIVNFYVYNEFTMSKTKPTKGKRFVKLVKGKNGRTRKISYGQKGSKISPGTAKGNAFCARTAKIKGNWKKDPNSKNRLSRARWKCSGKYSRKSLENEITVAYTLENKDTVELTLVKSLEFPQDTLLGDDGNLYTFTADNALSEFVDDSIIKALDDENKDDVLFDDEAIRLEDGNGQRFFFNKEGLYKDLTFYDELFIDVPVIQID